MRAQAPVLAAAFAAVVLPQPGLDNPAALGSTAMRPFAAYARPFEWPVSLGSLSTDSLFPANPGANAAPSMPGEEIEVVVGPVRLVPSSDLPVCSIRVLEMVGEVDPGMVRDIATDVDPDFTRKSVCAEVVQH